MNPDQDQDLLAVLSEIQERASRAERMLGTDRPHGMTGLSAIRTIKHRAEDALRHHPTADQHDRTRTTA